MEYTVAFDVTQGGFRSWWFPILALVFVVIGSGLVADRHRPSPRRSRFVTHLAVGFAALCCLAASVLSVIGYFRL
jgi:hypothetical protein